MSMNKTCPISNFTSEERSDGMSFVLSRNSRLNESISAQQSFASAFARLSSSSDYDVTSRRDLPSSNYGMAGKPAPDEGSLVSFGFWGNHLLDKSFETGIAAQVVEQWIDLEHK